jgi:trehalose-6-phosphate synthase
LKSLDYGLSISKKEKADMMKFALKHVEKKNLHKWTESFLKDLKLSYRPSSTSYYLGMNIAL